MATPPDRKDIYGQSFEIIVKMHTSDASKILCDPSRVREIVGAAFDMYAIQEEIDYTLQVRRKYSC